MNFAPTSDWLSPMLVKELRQGIKSRSFTFALMFLLGCVALVICIRMLMVRGTGRSELEMIEAAYWAAVAAPLLLIMPWSALMSVQNERKSMTLELLHLTSLTPLRLILGKWLSIMTRSLVLLSCVAPFFFVRYFIGGVNLALECVLLLVVVLLSALVTAICLYLSAFRLTVARWGLGLLLLFIVGIPTLVFFFFCQEESDQVLDAIKWPLSLTVTGAFALTTCYFLCAAAGRIAPEAVSYEPLKRITSLLVMGAVTLFGHLIGEPEAAIVAVCVAVIAGIDAMCAAPRINRSLFRPFARFGMVGRVAGRLLYPGWPSASFFVLLAFVCFALFCVIPGGRRPSEYEEVVIHFALCGSGAILSSWAAIVLFRKGAEQVDGAALIIVASQIALGLGVLMGGYSMRKAIPAFVLGLLPGTAFFSTFNGIRGAVVWSLCIVLALSLATLVVRALPYWRRVGEIERQMVLGSQRLAGEHA